MKRTLLLPGLLATLLLFLAGPAQAETVTFMGKAYCPVRYDIRWPFVMTVPQAAPAQNSGIVANVAELPKETIENKSATALGSDMRQLRILSAPLKVGQHVTEDQALITYEMPLENLMPEKMALSRARLNAVESGQAKLEYKLAQLRQRQADLENMAADNSVAPSVVRTNAQEIDALLLQRDYLREEHELAQQGYENTVKIMQKRYGKDVNIHNLPHQGYIRSPGDAYVLYVNSSLVQGMAFTKPVLLMTLGRLDPIVIRASVHEIAVQKLKVGDKVSVVFHVWPQETFTTTISKINFTAQPAMMQQPSFYEIEMNMPNPNLRIKDGMRCDVTVNLPDAAQ